ncbi:5944_t:CDS:2, partial [Acaulospora colombiana]
DPVSYATADVSADSYEESTSSATDMIKISHLKFGISQWNESGTGVKAQEDYPMHDVSRKSSSTAPRLPPLDTVTYTFVAIEASFLHPTMEIPASSVDLSGNLELQALRLNHQSMFEVADNVVIARATSAVAVAFLWYDTCLTLGDEVGPV